MQRKESEALGEGRSARSFVLSLNLEVRKGMHFAKTFVRFCLPYGDPIVLAERVHTIPFLVRCQVDR